MSDPKFTQDKLSINAKIYLSCIYTLNRLVIKGLVTRQIICTSVGAPEEGEKNLEGAIENDEALNPHWQAVVIDSSENNTGRRFFLYKGSPLEVSDDAYDKTGPGHIFVKLGYSLTTKGYDVSLQLLMHSYQDKRFEESNRILKSTDKSANAAKNTARLALTVAFILAAASVIDMVYKIEKSSFPNLLDFI